MYIGNFGYQGKHDDKKANGACSSHGSLGTKITVICAKKVKCTVAHAQRFCADRTAHSGNRGIGKGTVHRCTGTEALYRLYGP